ncbi:MAG: TldD/PmbA family protein [Promethearchaeota archaeon]
MEYGKDLADHAVDHAQSLGATYGEARYIYSEEESIAARNGVILSAGITPLKGLGIRVLVNGSMSFVSTAKLEKQHVEKLVKEAIKYAKASKRKKPIQFSEEKTVDVKWKTPVKIKFKEISLEDKQKFILDLDKELNQKFRLKLPTRTYLLHLYSENKYIVNSEGSRLESEHSLISFHSFNTAKGKVGSEQRMLTLGATGGWEWLMEKEIDKKIIEDNIALVNVARNAIEMKLDNVDVVISGEVSGIIAHENVGHPSEADRILGREGAQAGESFYKDLLKEGKLGEILMGNDCVSVIDDPTLPGSSGFYLYDDEGVKARPRYLIKEGKLNDLLFNREYAHEFNTHSNAAARSMNYKSEPLCRMANTFFEPGDFTKPELFEDIKKGVYLKSFTEWNIDDRRFQSKYVGLEAYLIENGTLTNTLIRRPILELTTFGILKSIDAISRNGEFSLGICGKGDPMQGIPVWLGGPHVRMRNIRLGGNK